MQGKRQRDLILGLEWERQRRAASGLVMQTLPSSRSPQSLAHTHVSERLLLLCLLCVVLLGVNHDSFLSVSLCLLILTLLVS